MGCKDYIVPDEVVEAIERALSDIQEGIVSFDADEYEPVIREWVENPDKYIRDEYLDE